MSRTSFASTFGPWALVTGASDGIGAAIASELAVYGLNLVLTARRVERLGEAAARIQATHPVDVRIIAADLAEPKDIEALASALINLEVGLFVGAAGFGTAGEFVSNDPASELNMIDVNCRAMVDLSHRLAIPMKKRGWGGIILLSSIVAFQGVRQMANYAATKAFVQTFAEGLSAELKPYGVKVLASAPGPVNTGFAARAKIDLSNAATPQSVARSTLRSLKNGGTVRPGALAKVLGYNLAILPRSVRSRLLGSIMAGSIKRRHAR